MRLVEVDDGINRRDAAGSRSDAASAGRVAKRFVQGTELNYSGIEHRPNRIVI